MTVPADRRGAVDAAHVHPAAVAATAGSLVRADRLGHTLDPSRSSG